MGGWDERLVAWVGERLRRRRERRKAPRLLHAALVEPQLGTLRHLAAAAAGRPVDVELYEGPPALAGVMLLLPPRLADAATVADNQRALIACVIHAGAWLRGGPVTPAPTAAGALRDLRACLAVDRALAEPWPGLARERPALVAALFAGRPVPAALAGQPAVLEALARAHLAPDASPPDDTQPEIAAVLRAERAGHTADADAAFAALRPGSWTPPPCWPVVLPAASAPARVQPAADPTRGPGTTPREVTSEREGKRRGPLARRRASRRAAEEENPLVHSFEKVKTIEAYQGGAKPMDGSDELDQHQAALDEVDLRETITSDEPTRSVYHAGLVTQGQLDEPGADAERRYDEWDHARRRYLPGYCGLREVVASGAAADAGRAWLRTIRQRDARLHEAVRATVEQVKLARRWQPRQLRGDELDIDRVVDRRVALAAGHDGTRRVYARRRRADRELAVLLLLDLSMSTDAWVEGRRVLDVERDAAAAVALGVDGLLAEVMIAGFFSNTRHDARYVHLKRADEDLAVAAARLAALEPQGYTRMGPAIRHAGARLARCAARERLLIVITDGKPSDRDRYEGRHGEADVRQAIRELAHERVHVLGIGVDPAAVRVMRAMFGARACTGLASPGAISDAIAQVLADFQR